MSTDVHYFGTVPSADPQQRPCRIIGKLKNLKQLNFSQVSGYLSPRVSKETWFAALEALKKTDSCSLWLVNAIVSILPSKASRHNSPSQPHALTKTVNQLKMKEAVESAFIIVCERSEVYALGCAVARSFPLYNRASSPTSLLIKTVQVGFIFVGDDQRPLDDQELPALNESCEAIRLAQYIVDAPCSEMHTDGFLEKVRNIGSKLGIQPHIIQGEALKDGKFGGIYGVGKAASHPPALAVLSHFPLGATKTIAWVGKGIVYDTGGLSIKDKNSMPGMKRDCGGAAAILGAFYTAVKLGFSENLHAVFCLAENSVGPLATRPDDVHILYSGKSVEINNTDAEGRLVLGDGVAYAKKDLKADVVVDMATLTGAQGVSTGRYHAAILTNNDDIEGHCVQAGKTSGDLVFPIPFAPELHFSEFKSAVADMKNSVKDRCNAQSSCAGLFIFSHLGFDYPGVWLHVDIAYPSFSGEIATGYGVALLTTLFGSLSGNKLIQNIAPPLTLASIVAMETDEQDPKRQKLES